MKFNDLATTATRAFHKAGFQLKKHSPEILVVTGVVGTVVSAVMACKATTKVDFVLEDTKKKVDIIHEGAETGTVNGYLDNGQVGMVPYTAKDAQKDLTIVYGQTALKMAKLYGPAVLVGATSIACILAGHNITRKRNLALAAAYTAVDTGFKKYRGRVVERFSEQLDKELLYDIKAQEVEEVVVNEDGTETVVKKTVEVGNPTEAMSPYTFAFSKDTSTAWMPDKEKNKFFLLQQQTWMNDKLKSEGRLFLNYVLKELGLPQCRMGQSVGWVYDSERGDGYVDFGIFDMNVATNRNFTAGLENAVWLTFNVDGDILYSL
jgi:hypothetical protein